MTHFSETQLWFIMIFRKKYTNVGLHHIFGYVIIVMVEYGGYYIYIYITYCISYCIPIKPPFFVVKITSFS